MDIVTRWAAFYGDHQLVSVGVTYLHLAGLMVGGGAAVGMDRAVLRAYRAGAGAREACLNRLAASHTTIVGALAVITISGVLMLAADLDTFLASRLFWTKLAVLGVLVANGGWILLMERRVHPRSDAAWRRLMVSATASLLLWLVLLLLGTWLPVGA